MTNLLANPIVIDGDLATSYKTQVASSLGTLFTLKIEKIIWVAAPAGASLSIGDPNSGLVLWSRKNDSAGAVDIEDDFTADPRLWRDFEINAFPGGTLYIYTR
jgi:hypothetical protein